MTQEVQQGCQMLLLSSRGYEVRQIMNILKVCAQTVYIVLKAWQQQGVAAVIRKKEQGRTPKLQEGNARHVEAVKKAVEKHSQSSNLILEELYAELAIEPMSRRSLRRFLKKWLQLEAILQMAQKEA